MNEGYQLALRRYADIGIDTEKALQTLASIPVSIHCWQGDDVTGLESLGGALDGGIQVTGNYPGRARTFEELTRDFETALSLIPGCKRLNLHASYAIGGEGKRDQLRPEHFVPWVAFAKAHHIGLDFNPTFFSHPMVKDNLTLSSPDEAVRAYWIRHAVACRRIAAYFARELGTHCLCNIWIPDGYKDVPADRLSPRLRLRDSLDQIFAEPLSGVIDSVESKFFGIGLEAYTVGSAEFYANYAATHPGVYNLMDSGHYHPEESIADKIPAQLAFYDKLPLHVTRPMHWDSDHVVTLTDDLRGIADEIVRCNACDKALIGLDFFDGSINRVAAWVIGTRNMQKALLLALLTPHQALAELQNACRFTELLALQEEYKSLPWGEVWAEYCRRQDVPENEKWLSAVQQYERQALAERK